MDQYFNNKKKLFVIFMLFAFILSIINITVEDLFFEGSANQVALKNATEKLNEREEVVRNFLKQSKNTLSSLRNIDKFNEYLNDKSYQNDIENIFLAYSRSHPEFMQLRYIDKNGIEKVRIDRDKENVQPYVVNQQKLQNKADRYYFIDSKEKQLEQVWFSPLDLNKENGKVEIPFRPTLRAILPINNNGKFDGILIVNYLMEEFLFKLVNTPLYDMILSDNQGYSLIHYDKSKSWGYYRTPRFSLDKEFPNEYKFILENKIYKTDTFVSKKLDLPIYGGLTLILQLKHAYVEEQTMKSVYQYLSSAFITLLASLILTYIIIHFYSKTLLNLEELSNLNKELNETTEQLTNEKHKYQTIFNHTQDGIALIDLESNFIDCNNAFLKLTGYNKNEILTKSCKDLTAPEDIEKNEQALSYARENGLIENIEKSCITKSGSMININMSISMLPDNKTLLLSLKDISSLKLLEQQEKLLVMGEMIGNIAHQWRQPLSVITTSASGLKMKAEYGMELLKENITEFSDTIVQQAEYLSNTIDNFKNFLRGDIIYKETSLKETLEQTLDLSSTGLKSNYILAVKNIEDDLHISGSINELSQAFINIISNSKDALVQNVLKGEDRFIFLTTKKLDEDTLEIIFKDSGGGIDEKILDRIFEPYFTTKHQALGTGLGLSMAYQVIFDRHRGEIKVSNEKFTYNNKEYTGACFRIVFDKKKQY